MDQSSIETMTRLRKQGRSYKTIGKSFGLSRQRVHQLVGHITPDATTRTNPFTGVVDEVTDLDDKQFPKTLFDWRARNGMNQTQAAEILETSIMRISNWETGKVHPAHSRLIIKVIRLWDYLLTDLA